MRAARQLPRASRRSERASRVRRRRRPREGPTSSRQRQKTVADAQAPPLALARRQLEDRLRAPPARGSPGRQPRDDLEDLEVRIEEDGVDRKAHERRVHGRGGTEEDALTTWPLAPAEQP